MAVLQAERQPWKTVRKARWACPDQSWVQEREGEPSRMPCPRGGQGGLLPPRAGGEAAAAVLERH